MNKTISVNAVVPAPAKNGFERALHTLGSQPSLLSNGIICITIVACVALVCFSGSEMSITTSGLTIAQPKVEDSPTPKTSSK